MDLIRCREVFFLLGAVHHVGILDPQQRPVGGDNSDFEPVDLVELGCFGFRRPGHSGQLLVHAEVVLESNSRERLIFPLDFDVLLGFHGLVQPIRPATARHEAAGELIDDDDFPIFHHVFHVAPIKGMRFDGGFDVVLQIPVLGIGNVTDAEQALDFFPTFVGNGDGTMFFVNDKIAGELLGLAGSGI